MPMKVTSEDFEGVVMPPVMERIKTYLESLGMNGVNVTFNVDTDQWHYMGATYRLRDDWTAENVSGSGASFSEALNLLLRRINEIMSVKEERKKMLAKKIAEAAEYADLLQDEDMAESIAEIEAFEKLADRLREFLRSDLLEDKSGHVAAE